MRKLASLSVAFALVAVSLFGCDDPENPVQPLDISASWTAGVDVTGCVYDAAVVKVHGSTLRGTDGDDLIDCTNANGPVRIIGAGGNDVLTGSAFDDRIEGGKGDDMLYGLNGNDDLYGGGGCDRLQAGPGDDFLKGGPGNDARPARLGCGVSDASEHSDTWGGLFGDAGADVLLGGPGVDALIGDPPGGGGTNPNDYCDAGPGQPDPTLQFLWGCDIIK
jgi:Ca2+-binding RTX toxin-like protein